MSIAYSAYPAVKLYQNRHLLILCTIIALIAGVSALTNLPRLEDPRITPRYPQITTFLPGASAARIEALVTDPIEDSLREISEIKDIESSSIRGVSVITAEIDDKVLHVHRNVAHQQVGDHGMAIHQAGHCGGHIGRAFIGCH